MVGLFRRKEPFARCITDPEIPQISNRNDPPRPPRRTAWLEAILHGAGY